MLLWKSFSSYQSIYIAGIFSEIVTEIPAVHKLRLLVFVLDEEGEKTLLLLIHNLSIRNT